jgi:hypothetical protein
MPATRLMGRISIKARRTNQRKERVFMMGEVLIQQKERAR